MSRKQQRLYLTIGLIGMAALATGLILIALRNSITYFYTPSELAASGAQTDRIMRLGGLVETGSVEFADNVNGDQVSVSFVVTDGGASTKVIYNGILPDLFREGQGVVAQGRLAPNGVFIADTVLAKHDENYMPKEVADALKEQGHWQEESGEY